MLAQCLIIVYIQSNKSSQFFVTQDFFFEVIIHSFILVLLQPTVKICQTIKLSMKSCISKHLSAAAAAQKPRKLRARISCSVRQRRLCSCSGVALSMINEVIIGENHWGSNPGAYLITNFLPSVSLPFPTLTLHHFSRLIP